MLCNSISLRCGHFSVWGGQVNKVVNKIALTSIQTPVYTLFSWCHRLCPLGTAQPQYMSESWIFTTTLEIWVPSVHFYDQMSEAQNPMKKVRRLLSFNIHDWWKSVWRSIQTSPNPHKEIRSESHWCKAVEKPPVQHGNANIGLIQLWNISNLCFATIFWLDTEDIMCHKY